MLQSIAPLRTFWQTPTGIYDFVPASRKPKKEAAPKAPNLATEIRNRITCPACNAQPGERCMTDRGTVSKSPHRERYHEFKLAYPEVYRETSAVA